MVKFSINLNRRVSVMAASRSSSFEATCAYKKNRRTVQGVPQLQAAAHPRHEEEEETDKTKQAQIEQTYEKH